MSVKRLLLTEDEPRITEFLVRGLAPLRIEVTVAEDGEARSARPPARMPGRLDQEPADVAVADLGDRALPALLAGGVLAGHQADEGHELLRTCEAAEAADLDQEREREQRVDATQAAQAR